MIADAAIRSAEFANLSRADWLSRLKTGDITLVRNGRIHFRAQLTDATPCFLFIGKLKFHRIVGTLVKRLRVNRLNLRLVRDEDDLT